MIVEWDNKDNGRVRGVLKYSIQREHPLNESPYYSLWTVDEDGAYQGTYGGSWRKIQTKRLAEKIEKGTINIVPIKYERS